nr:MAG TPA: hypothetical protein [Caudoviricetes sp.]
MFLFRKGFLFNLYLMYQLYQKFLFLSKPF